MRSHQSCTWINRKKIPVEGKTVEKANGWGAGIQFAVRNSFEIVNKLHHGIVILQSTITRQILVLVSFYYLQ